MKSKVPVRHLEMHVTHTCNLACPGCAHFCDLGYGGAAPFADGAGWLRGWGERLAPAFFRLLGGEPLLSADLPEYITLAADVFPAAERDVVTNGLLLPRAAALMPLLIRTGTAITVSVHRDGGEMEKVGARALAVLSTWRRRGLRYRVYDASRMWRRLFDGTGPGIKPADSAPTLAHGACTTRCTNIHQGRLYKCPPLAFLPMVLGKLERRDLWARYASHRPLEMDAADDQIRRYLATPAEECAMCKSH